MVLNIKLRTSYIWQASTLQQLNCISSPWLKTFVKVFGPYILLCLQLFFLVGKTKPEANSQIQGEEKHISSLYPSPPFPLPLFNKCIKQDSLGKWLWIMGLQKPPTFSCSIYGFISENQLVLWEARSSEGWILASVSYSITIMTMPAALEREWRSTHRRRHSDHRRVIMSSDSRGWEEMMKLRTVLSFQSSLFEHSKMQAASSQHCPCRWSEIWDWHSCWFESPWLCSPSVFIRAGWAVATSFLIDRGGQKHSSLVHLETVVSQVSFVRLAKRIHSHVY